jgi:hypothetical protein
LFPKQLACLFVMVRKSKNIVDLLCQLTRYC